MDKWSMRRAKEEEEVSKIFEESRVRVKVRVENLQSTTSSEECKTFFEGFENVEAIKRIVIAKNGLKVFKGSYDISFKEEESAAKFVELPEVKFGERSLSRKILHSCSRCSMSFLFRDQLRKHIGRLHLKKNLHCRYCSKTFNRKDNFDCHSIQQHNGKFTPLRGDYRLVRQSADHMCITCKKRFKSRLVLLKHLEFGEYCSFQCDQCTKTFTRKGKLEKHMQICNAVGDVGGTCEFCSETFEFTIDLERHRKKISGTDGKAKYVCWYCNKVNCSFELRDIHQKSDHSGPNVNQELENVNAESRRNRSLLDGVFVCEKCGRTSSSKEILLDHLASHESKTRTKTLVNISKPFTSDFFECDLCHTKFSLYKNFERHKRESIDDDENPRHSCDTCGMMFCTGKLLKAHLKTDHNPFECPYCKQNFTTKWALKRHQKTRVSCICSDCQKEFCTQQKFSIHMNGVHSNL